MEDAATVGDEEHKEEWRGGKEPLRVMTPPPPPVSPQRPHWTLVPVLARSTVARRKAAAPPAHHSYNSSFCDTSKGTRKQGNKEASKEEKEGEHPDVLPGNPSCTGVSVAAAGTDVTSASRSNFSATSLTHQRIKVHSLLLSCETRALTHLFVFSVFRHFFSFFPFSAAHKLSLSERACEA